MVGIAENDFGGAGMLRTANRTLSGIWVPVTTGGVLLLLLATGFEQILNYTTAASLGTHIFCAALAAVFALLLAVSCYGATYKSLILVAGLVLLVGLPVVYFVNASHEWQDGLALMPVRYWPLLPATADPEATQGAIWLAVGVISILGLSVRFSVGGRDLIILIIAVSTAVLSVVVLTQRLEPRDIAVYRWTGLFASPNHFAAFAVLVYPVAITSAIGFQLRAYREAKLSSPAGVLYVAAGVIAASVYLSGSRAGIAIVLLQTLGVSILAVRYLHREGVAGHRWLRVAAYGGLCLALMALVAGGAVVARAGQTERLRTDFAFRGMLWSDTLAMWRSRPVWGTGPGSFASVFPYYQSDVLGTHFVRHAHNDPLQFLAEFGLLGGALILAGVGLILLSAGVRRAGKYDDGLCPIGLSAGLCGVLMHSLVDFPLQHPLILLLACVWVGLLAGSRVIPCREHNMQQAF